jgi:hypothetical protein
MADQAAVTRVLLQLPDESPTMGFGADTVAALLDAPTTETKVILAGWRAVAAKAAAMGDVNESSSSRTNPLFDRAAQMIPIWQARADSEDMAAGTNVRQRGASRTAVRV